MGYRPIKKQSKRINLSKIEDLDLYFEEVPATAAYKLQRTLNRKLRKLKFA